MDKGRDSYRKSDILVGSQIEREKDKHADKQTDNQTEIDIPTERESVCVCVCARVFNQRLIEFYFNLRQLTPNGQIF